MKFLLIAICSTADNWESNTIYRTCIAYTEGEIIEIMYKRCILCTYAWFSHARSHYDDTATISLEEK